MIDTFWVGLLTGALLSMFLVFLLLDRVKMWHDEIRELIRGMRDDAR